MLRLPERELLQRLDTLETLASYLMAQDEQRRDLLWAQADILAAWVVARMSGRPVTPLYNAIAQATGSSTRFIRDLVRTASVFPPNICVQYADKTWQWFAECLRDGDPRDAAARYAEMSVREIRDTAVLQRPRSNPGTLTSASPSGLTTSKSSPRPVTYSSPPFSPTVTKRA